MRKPLASFGRLQELTIREAVLNSRTGGQRLGGASSFQDGAGRASCSFGDAAKSACIDVRCRPVFVNVLAVVSNIAADEEVGEHAPGRGMVEIVEGSHPNAVGIAQRQRDGGSE